MEQQEPGAGKARSCQTLQVATRTHGHLLHLQTDAKLGLAKPEGACAGAFPGSPNPAVGCSGASQQHHTLSDTRHGNTRLQANP